MSYTDTFSLNKGESLDLEREVESVQVSTGKILISDGDDGKQIGEGKSFDAKGSTTVAIHALEPTNGAIVFVVDPVVAPRPLLTDSEFEAVKDDREWAKRKRVESKDTSSSKSAAKKSTSKKD